VSPVFANIASQTAASPPISRPFAMSFLHHPSPLAHKQREAIKRPSARPDHRAASNGRQGGRRQKGQASVQMATDGGCQIRDTTSGPALGFRRLRCLGARRFPLASGLDAGPFKVKAPHQGPAALTSRFVFLACEPAEAFAAGGTAAFAGSRRLLQVSA
jgi:hypothetical protein